MGLPGAAYLSGLEVGWIVVSYTFVGVFALCWTDLVQGILMFMAIVIVPGILLSALVIYIVSNMDREPSQEIIDGF